MLNNNICPSQATKSPTQEAIWRRLILKLASQHQWGKNVRPIWGLMLLQKWLKPNFTDKSESDYFSEEAFRRLRGRLLVNQILQRRAGRVKGISMDAFFFWSYSCHICSRWHTPLVSELHVAPPNPFSRSKQQLSSLKDHVAYWKMVVSLAIRNHQHLANFVYWVGVMGFP